jgi:hypothetical protein
MAFAEAPDDAGAFYSENLQPRLDPPRLPVPHRVLVDAERVSEVDLPPASLEAVPS